MNRVISRLGPPLLTVVFILLLLSVPSMLYRTSEHLRLNLSAPISLLQQLIQDVGQGHLFEYTAGKTEHNLLKVLPEAITISGLFILASGVISIAISLLLSLFLPGRSRLAREITGFLSIVPDFILVLFLQIGVVLVGRLIGTSVVRIAWINSSRPALILPLISLSILGTLYLSRVGEEEVKRIKSEGFIQFARSRGIPEKKIISRHILPGILVAFKMDLLKTLSIIIGNLFIVEHLFNIPGITRFMFRYVFIADQDYFSFDTPLVTQVNVGLISLFAVIALFLLVYWILRGFLQLSLRRLQA